MTATDFGIGFIQIPLELIDHDKENNKEGINLETGEVDYDLLSTKALDNSLSRNGQLINLIVKVKEDGRFLCIDGNHRLPILRNHGYELVWAYNLGQISDAQAKLISLEINEIDSQITRKCLREDYLTF